MLSRLRRLFGPLRDIPVEKRVLKLLETREIVAEDARLLIATNRDAHLRFCEEFGVGNVIATFPMPFALAEHFVVNGCDLPAIPMVTEERHIVAGTSKAAKLVTTDGFRVLADESVARTQVLLEIPSAESYVESLPTTDESDEMLDELREGIEKNGLPFKKHGGGSLTALEKRYFRWDGRHFAEVTISITTGDAMGARGVTVYAKVAGEYFARTRDWKPISWICLNDNPARTVDVTAEWPLEAIGKETMKRVQDNWMWATKSPTRVVTHNKGIMNGIDAVALATGQDVRAIEAGAWSSSIDRSGAERRFHPLTSYTPTENGLRGHLKMQLTVGTVGGATTHPLARFSRRLMGVTSARDLMCVMGAVGLAQNFAALAWALNT